VKATIQKLVEAWTLGCEDGPRDLIRAEIAVGRRVRVDALGNLPTAPAAHEPRQRAAHHARRTWTRSA
jgi:hypothetical protein